MKKECISYLLKMSEVALSSLLYLPMVTFILKAWKHLERGRDKGLIVLNDAELTLAEQRP